jgi:hypothetical protein
MTYIQSDLHAAYKSDVAEEDVSTLTRAISSWYVRRDSKFYDVDHPTVKLSKDDVQRSCLVRFSDDFPGIDYSNRLLLKQVFYRAIDQKHAVEGESIPVWDGSTVCSPGDANRLVRHRGVVTLNGWKEPSYRRLTEVEPEWGVAADLFEAVMPRDRERAKFLDWLAWSLQNEADKPAWAPFLYSETKGSGKSTLCQLVARLFGDDNTAVQNNVDKLTSRFNSPVLTKKLVICEEVNLRPDSSQGNALKTFITEDRVLTERKGVDAEPVRQRCCFLFTSNHLPLWIEAEDRRYYLIDIDHDGHATGPRAADFAELVGRVRAAMDDEAFLAGLYRALMDRRLSNDFSAKTLNVIADATSLAQRVHGASELATVTLMKEHLAETRQHAVPEADVARIIAEELKGNVNQSKHLMTKLGWSKVQAKWGGKDYSRALWIDRGYWVDRGTLRGPDGYSQPLAAHMERPVESLLREDPVSSEVVWGQDGGEVY